MRRLIFDEDHDAFRKVVRSFFEKEVLPRYPSWLDKGPDRRFWRRCGDLGLLGIQAPTAHGGGGEASFKYNVILTEEAQHAGMALGGLRVHTDICMPYVLAHCRADQQERWLPRIVSGDGVLALAATEPEGGSDLRSTRTRAVRAGGDFLLNGAKTFISSATSADLVIVVARTSDSRSSGLSLLMVEADTPGLERRGPLRKIGLKYQDLGELSFENVRVPEENVIGEVGRGFDYLMEHLAQERISVSVNSVTAARTAVDQTAQYAGQREVFSRPLSTFQNTKFELAACSTEVEAAQSILDRAIELHESGLLTAADAARVKLFTSEVQGRVLDRCLQLFGGYGFTEEYSIGPAWVDARAGRLYAGSSEIMKVIIAKDIGL
jgi:acyl-CoA dehydrogenase